MPAAHTAPARNRESMANPPYMIVRAIQRVKSAEPTYSVTAPFVDKKGRYRLILLTCVAEISLRPQQRRPEYSVRRIAPPPLLAKAKRLIRAAIAGCTSNRPRAKK